MASSFIDLVELLLGVLIGVGLMATLSVASRRSATISQLANEVIPQGVDEMLAAFDTPGLVLDPSNNVLRVTPTALELGLVTARGALRNEIVGFVTEARAADREAEYRSDVWLDGELPHTPAKRVTLSAARIGNRYLVVMARDRSEEDRAEAVRRDFIANLSHELKTPAASVRLIAEAVERAAESPEQVRRFAERLGYEAERLTYLTAEVIELSRLQAEAEPEGLEWVKLSRVIQKAVHDHHVLAEEKNLTVNWDCERGLRVYGSAAELRTAVGNLIANAIAYSDPGGRVGVGAAKRDDRIEISVTDRGIGMDPAELERIFERFYRVDQARSRNTGGTGLGLSIVKHIAANHGGTVRAWSQPGKGSTFTLRLPRGEK